MTPSITYVAVYSDVHGAVTIASTLPPDTLDRRRLTSGEVLVQGFLQFAAKNGISTTANARHVSALQAALNLSSFDDVPAAQAAPEGWVLVPAKPTREWIGAVADDGYADCNVAQLIASILSHAPAAPTTQEAQRLEAPKKEAQELSPTAGMNIVQRILHVGGRNNAAGYVEFGSTQAVEALVRQVLRDLPQSAPAAQGDARLWCVYIHGLDEVHAMSSRDAALERANELNEIFGLHAHEDGDPIMLAVVIEWPHSADSHKQDIGAPHAF